MTGGPSMLFEVDRESFRFLFAVIEGLPFVS
jgi:hypothetical protein